MNVLRTLAAAVTLVLLVCLCGCSEKSLSDSSEQTYSTVGVTRIDASVAKARLAQCSRDV